MSGFLAMAEGKTQMQNTSGFTPGVVRNVGALWKRTKGNSDGTTLTYFSGNYFGTRIAIFPSKNKTKPNSPDFYSQLSTTLTKEQVAAGKKSETIPGPSFWEKKDSKGNPYLSSITTQSTRTMPGAIVEIRFTTKTGDNGSAPDCTIQVRQMPVRDDLPNDTNSNNATMDDAQPPADVDMQDNDGAEAESNNSISEIPF
jgi:hypothetical protein